MAKKSDRQKLESLKSGKDFVNYAEKKGATTRQGKGSHVVIEHEGKKFSVPIHGNKDLNKGIRSDLIKFLIAVGLGALAIFLILQNLPLTP